MIRFLHLLIFLTGLLTVGWVGAGYIGGHTLALAVTFLIALTYLFGALELWRYGSATHSLNQALRALESPPAELQDWLNRLHPTLRGAVRLRVEGARVGLPGPALTPYLVGLLVLLGMLGTFMGMVVTLQGTGQALTSAQDFSAIRNSLSAPVQGLGLAFGTSVAGVAASAMLGLLLALLRAQRAQAVQQLDAHIASTLRGFSPAQQRESSFALLQQQAAAMPALVEQVQALIHSLSQQNATLHQRLDQGQSDFHAHTQQSYRELASSVDQTLQKSLDHGARVAADALQPVVHATLTRLADESSALQQALTASVSQQLQGLTGRFEATSAAVAQTWQGALAEHQRASDALSQSLQATHAQAAAQQAERNAAMTEQLLARLDQTLLNSSQQWRDAFEHQQSTGDALSARQAQALDQAASRFDSVAQQFGASASTLVHGVGQQLHESVAALTAQWQSALSEQAREGELTSQRSSQALADASARFDSVAQSFASRSSQLFEGVDARLQSAVSEVAQQWQKALAQHAQTSSALGERTEIALASASTRFDSVAQSFAGHANQFFEGVDARLQSAVSDVALQWREALSQHSQASATMGERTGLALDAASTRFDALTQVFEQRAAALVDGVSAQLQGAAAQMAEQWESALARQAQSGATLTQATHSALQSASADLAEQGAALIRGLHQSHHEHLQQAAAQDAQRLSAWSQSLAAMRDGLQQHWTQSGTENAARQQQICDTLAATAREITAQSQAHARSTIEQIEQLMQSAAEAPRAAASVVSELRQKLSDSLVRDNAMLEERARILDTLSTLLDGVNHASTEQRSAIDALVQSSATLLERVGARFGEQVDGQTERLNDAAAALSASTIEVSSLGEAFGTALQHFGQGSERLVTQLERIEGALDQSLARSDEQLAYYVAQAREVIDLSVMSQKQVIEDLQQIASRQARAAQAAA